MADIFPTGYFAVKNALSGMNEKQLADATVVIIGCGFVYLISAYGRDSDNYLKARRHLRSDQCRGF